MGVLVMCEERRRPSPHLPLPSTRIRDSRDVPDSEKGDGDLVRAGLEHATGLEAAKGRTHSPSHSGEVRPLLHPLEGVRRPRWPFSGLSPFVLGGGGEEGGVK